MSQAATPGRAAVVDPPEAAAVSGVSDWLGFAATPGFALLALLTIAQGSSPADVLCAASHKAMSLNGMVPMYILMSAIHGGPWIRLMLGRQPLRS